MRFVFVLWGALWGLVALCYCFVYCTFYFVFITLGLLGLVVDWLLWWFGVGGLNVRLTCLISLCDC